MRTSHHSFNINLGNVKRRTPNRNGHKLLIMLFINLSALSNSSLAQFIHRFAQWKQIRVVSIGCDLLDNDVFNFALYVDVPLDHIFLMPVLCLPQLAARHKFILFLYGCGWKELLRTPVPHCSSRFLRYLLIEGLTPRFDIQIHTHIHTRILWKFWLTEIIGITNRKHSKLLSTRYLPISVTSTYRSYILTVIIFTYPGTFMISQPLPLSIHDTNFFTNGRQRSSFCNTQPGASTKFHTYFSTGCFHASRFTSAIGSRAVCIQVSGLGQ